MRRVVVTFTGFKREDVKKAAHKLKKEIKQSITKVDWSTSPQKTHICKLTQAQVRHQLQARLFPACL